MATFPFSMRRLILAGGFAVAAVAAPAITVSALPMSSAPAVACASGEEEDRDPDMCVPHTVPKADSTIAATADTPALPAVDVPGGGGAIPCTGANSGQC